MIAIGIVTTVMLISISNRVLALPAGNGNAPNAVVSTTSMRITSSKKTKTVFLRVVRLVAVLIPIANTVVKYLTIEVQAMSFCSKCGKQIAPDERFCSNCGTFVESASNSSDLHKCPNCGDNIDSFMTNCPSCGYEVRNIQAVSSVKEFADKLASIEASRSQCTSKRMSIYEQAYTMENLSSTDRQIISLVKSYPIPNAKEDLYEFLILAGSNIDPDLFNELNHSMPNDPQKAINNAWLAQFEHAYQKAKISFGSDTSFKNVNELYESIHDKIKQNKRKFPRFLITSFIVLLLFCAVIFSVTMSNKL